MKFFNRFCFFLSFLALAACQPELPPPAAATPMASPSTTAVAPPIEPAATPMASPTATATPRPIAATPTATPIIAPPAQPTGELTLAITGRPPETLNPLLSLDASLVLLSPLLYRPLMQLDPLTARPQPALAERLGVSADGLTITIPLTTATSLTAEDVQASIAAAEWPELADIKQVTVVDARTVSVSLSRANCALAQTLARLPVLRQTDVITAAPQATGPFAVKSQSPTEIQLIPNPAYDGPKPGLAALTLRFFETEAEAWQAAQAGKTDVLSLTTPPGAIPDGFRAIASPGTDITFVSFNNRQPPFDRPEIRRALSLAVDRYGALKTVWGNAGDLVAGFLPPTHWAADQMLAVPEYNPAQVAAMLDEAGWRDEDEDGWRDNPQTGQRWELGIRVDEGNQAETATALLVAEAYRQIGVHAYAEIVTFDVLIDDLLTYDYQAAVYSLSAPAELAQDVYWRSDQIGAEFGINLPGYGNPQVDEWLNEARRAPGCVPEATAALYRRIMTQLNEDRPVDFLFAPMQFTVAATAVNGLKPGPFAPLTWNCASWFLARSD